MNRSKELNVWQKSIDITTKVYQLTESFPNQERFGLVSQINRCCVSIPSNIAEGAGRNTGKDFYRFLSISLGSSFELETQLIIAKNLNYIKAEELIIITKDILEIQSMIVGLQKSINKN